MVQRAFPPLLDRLGFRPPHGFSGEKKPVEATTGFSGPKKGPISVDLFYIVLNHGDNAPVCAIMALRVSGSITPDNPRTRPRPPEVAACATNYVAFICKMPPHSPTRTTTIASMALACLIEHATQHVTRVPPDRLIIAWHPTAAHHARANVSLSLLPRASMTIISGA